jgi:NAD-dependent deacetylase
LHLHGNITYARSTNPDDQKLYPIKGDDLNPGDLCNNGFQLRPHVVWFGEDVPNMPVAQNCIAKADLLIVCGTSLTVYPAAGLVFTAHYKCKKYLIDPNDVRLADIENLTFIKDKASSGMAKLAQKLLVEA